MKGSEVLELETLSRIQRNREANGEQGFTLIELLIVIVVLGILAAIVVFALGGITSSSAAAACATDAQSVNVAIAAEQAQTPSIAPTGGASSNLVPTYLATWPKSAYYVIGVSGLNTTVQLVSGDPGASAATVYAPVGPLLVAQTFNGSSAYTYPAATGSLPWPANMAGQGICTGA